MPRSRRFGRARYDELLVPMAEPGGAITAAWATVNEKVALKE